MSAANDIAKSALEASPPVTFAALHFGGVALPDWVALAALIYTLMQIANIVMRWRDTWQRRHHPTDTNGPHDR